MSFTDKDRQALIELINNIQHSFFSEQSFSDGDSTKIALPCRLVRSAAEVLAQSYQPEMISKLDESEVELLLTYLSKAIEAVSGSLSKVAAALPEKTPASMLAKLNYRAESLEMIKKERAALFAAAQSLLESESAILDERQKLEDLQQRQRLLLRTQEQLQLVNLEELSNEVSRLETEMGSSRMELEQVQRQVAEREREREAISQTVKNARDSLSKLDQKSEEQAGLTHLCDDLLAALNPYMAQCEKGVQDALRALAEQTAEGKQLEQQLKSLMPEVSKVCEETAQLAAAVKLYADANHQLARSVPTVMSVTREKLTRIEEQLQEIDGELRLAISRHQSAKHVADTVSLGS
jgi:DNA repair exonuclease SbcCD ATPase subunit